MPHRRPPQLEWYKLLLILIGAFGIVLAIVHWYVSGTDIPNGILTLLTLIVSATLGPNAISSVADIVKNGVNSRDRNRDYNYGRQDEPDESNYRNPEDPSTDQEEDSPYPITQRTEEER